MSGYYDDNFGGWDDMDDPDMVNFYRRVQETNVEKVCVICGDTVRIQPHYDKCNSCCEKIERGFDY